MSKTVRVTISVGNANGHLFSHDEVEIIDDAQHVKLNDLYNRIVQAIRHGDQRIKEEAIAADVDANFESYLTDRDPR